MIARVPRLFDLPHQAPTRLTATANVPGLQDCANQVHNMASSPPFDGDEDAALRYAIELSLRDSGAGNTEKAIEISSDEDDDPDDLDAGPSYPSLTSTKSALVSPKRAERIHGSMGESISSSAPTPTPPASTAAVPGLAGLDRKRMEEERLARLGKRKAPESSTDETARRQKPRLGDGDARKDEPNAAPRQQRLPFPKGVVKKTWAFGYSRQGDDIKIEEVLQKNQLEMAVLSSFQWDEEWMLSKIDIQKTKLILIAFASSETQVRSPLVNMRKRNY